MRLKNIPQYTLGLMVFSTVASGEKRSKAERLKKCVVAGRRYLLHGGAASPSPTVVLCTTYPTAPSLSEALSTGLTFDSQEVQITYHKEVKSQGRSVMHLRTSPVSGKRNSRAKIPYSNDFFQS